MTNSMQTALQMLQVNLEQNWIEHNRKDLTKEQKKLYSSILSMYFFIKIVNVQDLLLADLQANLEEWSEIEKMEEIMSKIIKKDKDN